MTGMTLTPSHVVTFLALFLPALVLQAQNVPSTSGDAAPVGQMAPARDGWQGAWSTTDARRAAETWKALSEARPSDVNAQFNWFRSERNARLGSNNGRLQEKDNIQLETIAGRIRNAAPGSFEQHLASYYLAFPGPEAFTELDAAHAAGAGRTELILPMLTRANLSGDKAAQDHWSAQLEQRGGLSPALADVASDLLLSTGEGGILFTNGDMDGAPALMLQRLHDQRRDVLLVDQRLLNDMGYRQRIWKDAKATGPVPAAGPAFARALSTATERPVFLALSLDRSWFDAFPEGLYTSGIAFAVGGTPPDGRSLAERWDRMKKTTAAGPLSRNYLLPGSVLLQQYRSNGDEAHASRLEHELRGLATRLGATQDLIKAGVFTH